MVFGWAQIVMDMQPLAVMITGEGELHGFSHTYVGATLLALFSALTGKYLSEFGLDLLRVPGNHRSNNIGWKVTLGSAFIGTFSHVFLDSIMHLDVQPYYPFTGKNSMYSLMTMEGLHFLCIASAIIGAAAYFLVHYILDRKKRDRIRA